MAITAVKFTHKELKTKDKTKTNKHNQKKKKKSSVDHLYSRVML